jgi:BirA family transcriptional regulator, biotin operon repressor / biotin---[acetyl-CoA-carboxylase] ligase
VTVAPADASPTVRRRERFSSTGSTNDIVRAWLANGEPEICVAVADEQTAGRGRAGRTWTAPSGAGLLLSLGFRPRWLPAEQVWRLAAAAALAMADASEDVAGLARGTVRLKWPNDLVVVTDRAGRATDPGGRRDDRRTVRKLGGILGETDGLGSLDPVAIVGIGLNANWRSDEFPPDLAASMTSLRAVGGDRPVDPALLLEGFLACLEPRLADLARGRFDDAGWDARQITTGREIDITLPGGTTARHLALGVDPVSGALVVADPGTPAGQRSLLVGEIRHVRLAGV